MLAVEALRVIVRSILERSAWKDKAPEFNQYADLVAWTDKGAYVSFVDVDKLGVNPGASYANPLGVWGYPLDRTMARAVMTGDVRFGGSRKYVQIFKPKSPSSVLDLDALTPEGYAELEAEALTFGSAPPPVKGTPGEKIWALTKGLARGNPVKWSAAFQKLGFDGVLDRKRGIAVFFGAQTLDHLSTLRNPAHDPDDEGSY